jgi:hypothetical protein
MLGECSKARESTVSGWKLNSRDVRLLRNLGSLLRCWLHIGLAK